MLKPTLFFILIFSQVLGDDYRIDEWQRTKFVWNYAIASMADHGLDPKPIRFFKEHHLNNMERYRKLKEAFTVDYKFNPKWYRGVENGGVIFLPCQNLPHFCSQFLDNIEQPFSLIISPGDEMFPSESGLTQDEVNRLLSHRYLRKVFVQNYDGTMAHPKITLIPIGLDYHTVGYKSSQGWWGVRGTPLVQEMQLLDVLRKLEPTTERIPLAFVDFHHSNTMRTGDHKRYVQFGEDREAIYRQLLANQVIRSGKQLDRLTLWKTKGRYMFSICPHGNGLDTHRVWEDLVLGCIVIVKRSSLDPLYKGLPVVIVNDWSEVTTDQLKKWAAQYGDVFNDSRYRVKLKTDYWLDLIKRSVGAV